MVALGLVCQHGLQERAHLGGRRVGVEAKVRIDLTVIGVLGAERFRRDALRGERALESFGLVGCQGGGRIIKDEERGMPLPAATCVTAE